MGQRIGIPKEIHPGEKRVAATPETTKKLIKMGFDVAIESQAGAAAHFPDAAYAAVGAKIIKDYKMLWQNSDVVLKVRPPEALPLAGTHEADLLRQNAHLVSFFWPAQNQSLIERLQKRHASVTAVDAIPRITRAQKMDALSSMANIAGYRAVIEASQHYGSFFTGQITAAGKVAPAKVLVIGAGVAGLSAIGTARALGAIVRAFDTRPEVKEQVQSMGAEFLDLEFEEDGTGEGGYAKVMSKEFIAAEMQLFAEQARDVDIIVTTALIPGKKAPLLITEDMVKSMQPGSVIVDLAAEQGGNCACTKPGQAISAHGVTVIGYEDLPSRLPTTASQLYGTNLVHLLADMSADGVFQPDKDDEVAVASTVLRQGELTWPPPKLKKQVQTVATNQTAKPAADQKQPIQHQHTAAEGVKSQPRVKPKVGRQVLLVAALLTCVIIGSFAPPAFLGHFTVFVLACFIGWQVVWNVKPALHTPLMSVTNAISGIIVVGAMLQFSGNEFNLPMILACIAVLVASINIAGGFLVTQRMLKMFRK